MASCMIFANPASKPQNLSSRKLPETVSLDKKERQREREIEKRQRKTERGKEISIQVSTCGQGRNHYYNLK